MIELRSLSPSAAGPAAMGCSTARTASPLGPIRSIRPVASGCGSWCRGRSARGCLGRFPQRLKETRSVIHPLHWMEKVETCCLCRLTLRVCPSTMSPTGGSPMKRFITIATLGVGLVAGRGVASAQDKDVPVIVGNVDSTCVTSPSLGNPGANAGDWTITCGDITPGSGITVIAPPSADAVLTPADLAPAAESAPAAEPAPVADPGTDTPVDAVTATAEATDTDTDGD